MIIHWEDIRFEVDDAGTSWATLADDAHNSLTLEWRDGAVTFHADGSPRFDVGSLLEITALCMILAKDELGKEAGAQPAGPSVAVSSHSGETEAYIPGQRQASDINPAATRLAESACPEP
jgi:hypothetical protein